MIELKSIRDTLSSVWKCRQAQEINPNTKEKKKKHTKQNGWLMSKIKSRIFQIELKQTYSKCDKLTKNILHWTLSFFFSLSLLWINLIHSSYIYKSGHSFCVFLSQGATLYWNSFIEMKLWDRAEMKYPVLYHFWTGIQTFIQFDWAFDSLSSRWR